MTNFTQYFFLSTLLFSGLNHALFGMENHLKLTLFSITPVLHQNQLCYNTKFAIVFFDSPIDSHKLFQPMQGNLSQLTTIKPLLKENIDTAINNYILSPAIEQILHEQKRLLSEHNNPITTHTFLIGCIIAAYNAFFTLHNKQYLLYSFACSPNYNYLASSWLSTFTDIATLLNQLPPHTIDPNIEQMFLHIRDGAPRLWATIANIRSSGRIIINN